MNCSKIVYWCLTVIGIVVFTGGLTTFIVNDEIVLSFLQPEFEIVNGSAMYGAFKESIESEREGGKLPDLVYSIWLFRVKNIDDYIT